MKKAISLMLVLALLVSMVPSVFAATTPTVTVTADKTEVKAGDSITLTLTIDQSIENLMNFEFNIYFDPDAYTKTGSTIGEAYKDQPGGSTVVGDKISRNGGYCIPVSGLSTLGDPITLSAGMIATVTFTATENITSENAGFETKVQAMNDYDTIAMIEGGVNLSGESISVTVAADEPAVEGYTVSMGEDKSITAGEVVEIPVTIGYGDDSVTTYNAYDMTFSYDSSLLNLNMTETNTEGYRVIAGDGTVRVIRYGDSAELGEALKLSFIGKSTGSANVKVDSAYVDIAANSIELDAPEATVIDDGVTVVTVEGYLVSLPDDFTPAEGEDLVVDDGESFTFVPKDPNYDYDITVTVGGEEVEITENEDGSYTVPDIHGNVVITATKTPKSFSVTKSDDITGEDTATYLTEYTFTLTQKDGYSYNLAVTIDGTAYTGYDVTDNGNGTFTYTIPGADITGVIDIQSNAEEIKPNEYTVTFVGGGAGDVAEGAASTVTEGETYTFTLNKADGFNYTVTATMGGSDVALTEGENGSYSIANVTGDLIITITKESTLTMEIAVSTYVELDGKTMFLVTVTGTPEDGKAFAYDGNVMYKTTAYGENVYAWLVIVDGDSLTEADASAMITTVSGTAEELSQTYDVNMTGVVDINDAQLTYDMYNGKYSAFETLAVTVSVQKFLNADVNSDKQINSADAVAIVANAQ